MLITNNDEGTPGSTITVTASADTVIAITSTALPLTSDGKNIQTLLISVETNSARISFTANASQTLGHLRAAGDSMQVSGLHAIKKLKFANATAGSNTVIQLTPFY